MQLAVSVTALPTVGVKLLALTEHTGGVGVGAGGAVAPAWLTDAVDVAQVAGEAMAQAVNW